MNPSTAPLTSNYERDTVQRRGSPHSSLQIALCHRCAVRFEPIRAKVLLFNTASKVLPCGLFRGNSLKRNGERICAEARGLRCPGGERMLSATWGDVVYRKGQPSSQELFILAQESVNRSRQELQRLRNCMRQLEERRADFYAGLPAWAKTPNRRRRRQAIRRAS